MSRSISLYFSETIDTVGFLHLVTEMGGVATDTANLDIWFSDGHASVWIYDAKSTLAGDYEEPEESTRVRLGGNPNASLVFALSHETESGPLAVAIAVRLLRHWRGIAELATYLIADVETAAHWSASDPPQLLGSDVRLFFTESIDLSAALNAFDVIFIDPDDRDMTNSAHAALRRLVGGQSPLVRETVVAMVSCGQSEVWLLQRTKHDTEDKLYIENLVEESVERRLGAKPACEFRLVMDCQMPAEEERAAVLIAAVMIARFPGVMTGIFSFTANEEELTNMMNSGDSIFVS